MTIQRHYDLPNCRLTVEGWSSDAVGQTARPVLSVVTNAECRLTGHPTPLKGDKDFIQGLAQAVSAYAQGVLSTIPRSSADQAVQITRLGHNRHQLTVSPSSDGASPAQGPQELELSTVQLFDLVEAVDQLVADTQTLPDLVLPLSPVSRRAVPRQEPVSRQLVPAALGVSGLAAAAIALFFIPPPEFRPAELEREAETEQIESVTPDPLTEEGPPPEPPSEDADDATPLAPLAPLEGSGLNDGDAATSSEGADPPSSVRETEVSDAEIDELFTRAAPLSDADQLSGIVSGLQRTLGEAWNGTDTEEDLIYRIGTNSEGTIIGYRYVNDAASEYADQTPLLELTQPPSPSDVASPIGQFRVVMRPSGVVEVSPWYGRPPEP